MSNFIDYIIMVVAIFMSLVLLYLICFCTPKIMKSYKPLLLCGWFADFIFVICGFIGRPLYLSHDGVLYMISSMFASHFNNYWINSFAIIVFIYGFMQLMIMPALQFFSRYLMIVWNIHLKTHKLILLMFTLCLIPISYCSLAYVTCSDAPFYQKTAIEVFDKNIMTMRGDNGTFKPRHVLACDTSSNMMIVVCIHAFLQVILIYGSIYYFGLKIYKQLKLATIVPQMQSAQRQITIVLMVQAIIVPLLGGLPLVYIFSMAFFKINSFALAGTMFDRSLALVSIINPMLSIYFVKHYHQTVINFFRHPTKSLQTNSQVSFTPTSLTW